MSSLNNMIDTTSKVDTKEIEEFINSIYANPTLDDSTIVQLASSHFFKSKLKQDIRLSKNKLKQYLEDNFGYKYIRQEAGRSAEGYTQGIFELNNRFYAVEWLNTSYGGMYTDEALQTLKEVKPKEKTIVVYEYI